MALPPAHREEIEILARRWRDLVRASRRTEMINRGSTAAILICGGALLIFPETLSASAAPVTVLTGGFVWGGWYKMYKIGNNRRRMRAEAAETEERLVALCGEGAAFEGDDAAITKDGRLYDPFGDDSYG